MAFERVLVPIAREFKPDIVFISAGAPVLAPLALLICGMLGMQDSIVRWAIRWAAWR